MESMPFDVSARGYASIATRHWQLAFRAGFTLREEIDPEVLRQAVEDLRARFPSMYARVRRGWSWPRFAEPTRATELVHPGNERNLPPVEPRSARKSTMFRVFYQDKRFFIYFPHVLTDGGGATIFLKTLLARYLELQGHLCEQDPEILDLTQAPRPSEWEDLYIQTDKLERKKAKEAAREEAQEKLKSRFGNFGKSDQCDKRRTEPRTIEMQVRVASLKAQAQAFQITITEYVTAAFLYALWRSSTRPRNKKIVLQVPISLRRRGEDTMNLRNFTMFSFIGFDAREKEEWTFAEVVERIRGQMQRNRSPETLRKELHRCVSVANHPLQKIVPFGLKHPIIRVASPWFWHRRFTASFSNIGMLQLPPTMRSHIAKPEYAAGDERYKSCVAVMVSDPVMCYLYFTLTTQRDAIPQAFSSILEEQGIESSSGIQ